jgi:predicted acylesterase/phospholipase RssA
MQSDPNQRIQIGPKKKIALVCSGGGSKAGAFHLGVCLALREAGFRFVGGKLPETGPAPAAHPMDVSLYVGSSAGSLITTFLASGYSLENIFNSVVGKRPGEVLPADMMPRILPKLNYQKMFRLRPDLAKEQIKQFLFIRKIFSEVLEGNWSSLLRFRWMKATGLFSTAGIEQYLREEVLETNQFKQLFPDLFIVATKLNHSRKVVFGKYSYQPPPHDLTCQYDNEVAISEACAASTALPFPSCSRLIRSSKRTVRKTTSSTEKSATLSPPTWPSMAGRIS